MKSTVIASWVIASIFAPIGLVLVIGSTVAFCVKRGINPLREEEGV